MNKLKENELNEFKNERMKQACELATKSVNNGCGPFGCIITDANYTILSEGHNQVTELNDPTAHAEIMAIRNACKTLNTFELSNCKLFTSCEPCPMCLSAIYWARITNIFYSNTRNDAKNIGFDDEFIYDEIKKDIDERKVKLHKIKSTNSIESFDIWANSLDKTPY
jgi:tRNA(Arg) A34 adenosine deaminase TadA